MEIRLEYKGQIPSSAPKDDHRSDLKQQIRREFSNQLRRRWRDSPLLAAQHGPFEGLALFPEGYRDEEFYRPEDKALPFFRVQMCGFAWVPLVTWHNRLGCELDVTFTGDEFSTITRGGDLDNRLKTLFDSLRMPLRSSEVPGNAFGHGEQVYCLLEDDSLIRKFCVTAVQSPFSPAEHSVLVVARVVTMDGYIPHPALEGFR